jgi:catechol 2,3-dioxygenase-like lactoylglutathione lyase family enzyme
MLGESPLYVAIPVTDLRGARRFYEGVLGLTPLREGETEVLYRSSIEQEIPGSPSTPVRALEAPSIPSAASSLRTSRA